MLRFPRQNSSQAPRSRLCNFNECSRGAVFIILDSHSSNWNCIGRYVADFKLGIWRKMHPLRMRFTPWNKPWLENISSVLLSFTIRNAKAAFGAKACAPLAGWFEGKYRAACFARFFHSVIIAQGGLGTVPDQVHYCQLAEREVSMPSLFDLVALDASQEVEAP